MTTTKIKHFICNKCCRTVKPSQVIVINKKLVCPFCFRTLETDKSKADFVDKLKKAMEKNN